MNKYQTKGMYMYIVGSVEESVGKFVRSSHRQVKGYQRKVAGKAIMALGDAHRALQLCINAPLPELEGNSDIAAKPVRQTSKL